MEAGELDLEQEEAGLRADARALAPLIAAAGHNLAGFGERFYARLFALLPAARAFFPADMTAQQDKLARTLVTVLDLFEQGRMPRRELRLLGARHRAYGAQPLHYAIVGQALSDTLAERAGEAFTAELRQAWHRLYASIVSEMLAEA